MKRTKLLLALVAVVVLCLSLAACDNHTHTYGEWTLTTQPTETATGEATRTCTECGEAETVTVAALSDTTVWTASTTAATHTEDGKTVYTSTYGTVEIKLPKLADNHVFDKQVVDAKYLKSEATCTEAAVYYKSCVCGESSKEHGGETFTTGEALGHDFEHGTEVAGSRKAATCIAAGEYKVKCSRCDEVKTITLDIDSNAHDWDEGTITTPATCSAEGVKTFTCKHDSTHTKTESVAIDPDAHDWNEGVITTPATCSATGVKTYTCAHNSNHTRTETVPVDPNAHKAKANWTVDKPATCTENGSKSHHCEYCDAKLDNEVIPATGHGEYKFVDWATEPTETAAGVANVKCGKCNAELTQEVAALTAPMWTKTETPATYDAAGNKAYTATVFGSEQTINVAIARHIAPYEGKTYQLVSFGNANGNINGKYFKDPDNDSVSYYITYSFVVGEAGLSTDTFNRINADYYTDGKVQFSGYDASTGKFNVTFTYKEKTFSGYDDYGWDPEETVDKEETTWGCVSADGSALYIYKGGSSSSKASHYFAVAGTEQIAVSGTQAQAARLLLDGNKAVCLQLGSTMFFVDENNVVFGATLADLEGKALTIANYTDSTVVIVNDASGTKVGAFARVVSADGKADYIACDGYEGIYTGGLGEQAYINGVGGITVKGLGYELVGTYAKVEGSDNEFDVLLDNGGMEYYLVTVTGNTYTKTKVMTTINYDLDGGTLPDGKTSDSVNIKVEFTLPTPAKDGYKFMGWYKVKLDGEFDEESFVEDGKTTIEQAEGMEHVFYARFVENANITFTNLDGQEDKHVSACVNDKLLANAPEYVENVTKHSNGTQIFAGWYLDKNFTRKIDAEYEVTEADAGQSITVYAKWADLNTLKLVYGHGIEDKELYMALNDNVAEIIAAANANIKYNGGRPFVAWYIDTNGNGIVDAEEALLTESDVCSGNMTLVAKWNEEVSWTIKLGSGSNYPFVYDSESGTWKSSNNGTGYATSHAQLEIIAKSGTPLEVSFELTFAKTGSDELYFRYYKDGKRESETIQDGITSRKFVGTICKTSDGTEQHVQIDFKKSMLNSASFVALTNLTINGVAITTPNSPDFKDGTYTNETLGDLVLDGFGAGTINGEALTYTVAAKDAGYTLIAKTANKTYKVTLNGSTYTAEEWNVTVSFYLGVEGQTKDSVTLAFGTTYQLTEEIAPTIDGYIFRGWYSEAGFDNEITSVDLTTDVTVYAKYDPAVTLTFDYNGQGTENVVINGKFKGDTIGNVIPDASELTKDGQSFVGWFLKDGENWGEKATADTILQNSVTYYAKWADAPKSVGVYKGWNLYGNKSGSTQSSFTKDVLTVNVDGTFAYGSKTGALTAEQMQVVDGSMVLGGTYYYFNKELGAMWRKYDGGKADGVGTDTDIAFLEGTVTSIDYCGSASFAGGSYVALMQITYANGDVKTAFLYDNKIVANVTLSGGKTFKNALSGSVVVSKDGVGIAKLENNKILNSDGLMGEYTGEGTLSINGFGDFTVGDISGTYTIAADDAGYTLLAKTETETYKITLSGDTYTMEAYNVAVSFDFGTLAELAGEFADQIIPYDIYTKLNDAPTIEGYKFRGWYRDSGFNTKVTNVKLTEDITIYAKYDPIVTITFDYSGYEYEEGKTTKVIDTLAIGDTLSNLIPVVDASVRYQEKAFAGWFLKDGENWGAQAASSTKVTEAVTYYAKWIEVAVGYGEYKGFEVYNTWAKDGVKPDTLVLSITAEGKFSGKVSGTLSEADATKTCGAIDLGRYGFICTAGDVVVVSFGNNSETWGKDLWIGFRNSGSISTVKYSAKPLDDKLLVFMTIYYNDNTTKGLLVVNDTLVFDTTFTVAGTAINGYECASNTNGVLISQNGNALYLWKNGALMGADGLAGTYTGEYGAIELDGYGTLAIGGQSVVYTADGNKITFIAANAMRVVELGEGTYTKALDGYQDTYTLPDDAGTITLDGYGNAGESATYVVSGTSITIYTADGRTTYGIDVDNKQLLGKSVFAGLTFTGTYIAQGESTKIMFIFDDSSMLTGVVQTGSFGGATIKFTATFDGTTLVLTFDAENEVSWDRGQTWKSGDFGGKNIVATLSGNTFTIVSTTVKDNPAYTFANSGTLACPDYAA